MLAGWRNTGEGCAGRRTVDFGCLTSGEEVLTGVEGRLLTEDKITQEYIDKIIEIAEETGPYIFVPEYIALPRAPSKYGAKELAMGITVLRTPIEFCNEANDPVRCLFSLSAKGNYFKFV